MLGANNYGVCQLQYAGERHAAAWWMQSPPFWFSKSWQWAEGTFNGGFMTAS